MQFSDNCNTLGSLVHLQNVAETPLSIDTRDRMRATLHSGICSASYALTWTVCLHDGLTLCCSCWAASPETHAEIVLSCFAPFYQNKEAESRIKILCVSECKCYWKTVTLMSFSLKKKKVYCLILAISCNLDNVFGCLSFTNTVNLFRLNEKVVFSVLFCTKWRCVKN